MTKTQIKTHLQNFVTTNAKANITVQRIVNTLGAKNCIVLPGKNDVGYDMQVKWLGDLCYNVEVKSNKGTNNTGSKVYSTFFLETWADHNKTIKPEWRTSAGLHKMYVVNEYEGKCYVFNILKLRAYANSREGMQSTAGGWSHANDGQAGKTNHGIKVQWECKEAGWEHTFLLKDKE